MVDCWLRVRAGLSDVDGGKVGDGVVQVSALFLTGRTQAEIQEYCGGCTSKNLTPFNF